MDWQTGLHVLTRRLEVYGPYMSDSRYDRREQESDMDPGSLIVVTGWTHNYGNTLTAAGKYANPITTGLTPGLLADCSGEERYEPAGRPVTERHWACVMLPNGQVGWVFTGQSSDSGMEPLARVKL